MLGLQSSKSLKHAKKQQNLDFFRIFAEFSRKFALKVHEEPCEVGVRFFSCTIAKVFRRFQVVRDSFSLEKPRTSVAALKVSDFCVDRFVATRGKLRVSEVCSNKPKFSNL